MDTKLVVIANTDRLAYNGTQNLLVQGKNYANFAVKYLEPFFSKKVNQDLEEIEKFNCNVKEMLGQKNTALNPRTNSAMPFNCPECNVRSTKVTDLKMHMKSSHSWITQKNKSKVKAVMHEDLSLIEDIDNSIITLEENLELVKDKQTIDCDQDPCEYGSADKSQLIKHIGNEHIGTRQKTRVLPEMENLLSCYMCEFETDYHDELRNHMKSIHDQIISSPNKVMEEGPVETIQSTDEAQTLPVEAIQSSVEEEGSPLPEMMAICGTCAKGFETETLCTEHMLLKLKMCERK